MSESNTVSLVLDQGCGVLTVPLDKIRSVDNHHTYFSVQLAGGGYVHCEPNPKLLIYIYRKIADRLERNEIEAVESEGNIS